MIVFLALAGTGLADLVSTVIRQTLRQLLTPDALRGRMTSVNMIFFMGGPQLGEMEAGLVASMFTSVALGARVSVVIGGVATLLVTAMVASRSRVVRDYEPPVGRLTARRAVDPFPRPVRSEYRRDSVKEGRCSSSDCRWSSTGRWRASG